MQTAQVVSMPFPTKWGINADIAGRPIVWGALIISSIADNRVTGTINFRGTPIPIQGSWNENAKQIQLDSPYATYSGNLTIFDDPPIRIRHFILSGRLIMKPPSLQAGEYGTWIATTDINQIEYPVSGSTLPHKYTDQLPPVGVFLTSNLLYGQQNFRGNWGWTDGFPIKLSYPTFNKENFITRKDYIAFNKKENFEVSEYSPATP